MKKLLWLVLLAGCDLPTDPFVPVGAVEYDAPSVYEVWWREVEMEAGIYKPMSGLHFLKVPAEQFYHPDYQMAVSGLWTERGRSIYIAEPLVYRRGLVKHEMLHDLLGGDTEHKNPLFRVYSNSWVYGSDPH